MFIKNALGVIQIYVRKCVATALTFEFIVWPNQQQTRYMTISYLAS